MTSSQDSACLFCRIVSGEIPSTVIYSDDLVIAFRDLNPQAPLHALIIPRAHVAGIDAVEPGHGDILAAMAQAANAIARNEHVAESGFRLVMNAGPDAGQSVFHLHMHILGGRKLGWPPG